MTSDYISKLKAAAEAATNGNFYAEHPDGCNKNDIVFLNICQPSNILRLIAYAETLREGLEFYASKSSWTYCHLPGSGLGDSVIIHSDRTEWDTSMTSEKLGGKSARERLAKADSILEGE